MFDNAQIGLYRNQTMHNEYQQQSGVFEMPLAIAASTLENASPQELANMRTVRVIRMHAPYMKRVVRWNTEKNGNPPVIPSPKDTDNMKLLGASWGMPFPTMNANQQNWNYSVSGEYVYVETFYHPYKIGFCMGALPYNTPVEIAASSLGQIGLGAAVGGAIGGADSVVNAILESKQIDFNSPYWEYCYQTYFSPAFFDDYHIAGDAEKMEDRLPQIYQSTANIYQEVPPRF